MFDGLGTTLSFPAVMPLHSQDLIDFSPASDGVAARLKPEGHDGSTELVKSSSAANAGKNGISASIWVGLWFAIILDTGVQVCWKVAVAAIPDGAAPLDTVVQMLRQPIFLAVCTMFFAQLFNWLRVLGKADLSYAQPITSLSYVSVAVLSAVLLHENLSLLQLIGISLILCGVWVVSQTDQKSRGCGS